jgi:cell wall-associated NlpC family hydrolase
MGWYDLTKKYNNLEYKKGSQNLNEGLDCLTLLFSFYADMGIDLTKLKNMKWEYKKKIYTIDNYTQVEPSTNKRNKIFKAFLKQFFKAADTPKKGDLILFKFRSVEATGIYMGKSIMMCALEDLGIRNIKIKNSLIEKVYTWQ